MRKTTQLKNLLRSKQLEYLMEAHNGLSARIVDEAGFSGIWASGLSISASLGLRDNNEASWTQVLDVTEYMSDASSIPILLDADTGFGNFNNVRRLVRKLEQRQVSGMCIEDKIFPKSNSFREGKPQPMAPMDEFVGKIKAAKDTQQDPDFCVVARVESLIAGYGLEEALRRARAYAEAGADAVLIHSKLATAFQIIAFMEHWKEECPVVIVPTKYYTTPVEVFETAGISVVIWANHLMRSSITAMQQVASQIRRERSLVNVEPAVATLEEVFRLQNEAELSAAEARYLPAAPAESGAGTDRGVIAPDRPLMPRSGTDGRPVHVG
jgi:phosphoenolpyruvate phosphomutase